jgi:uncharacterized protein YdhG (YjbR/CyaY superfamily)
MAPTKRTAATSSNSKTNPGFSAEEKAAMRERAKELKNRELGESDLLAQIKGMPAPDRAMAQRIHTLIKRTAPSLMPRTWYGMPAYNKDGSVLCFFRAADKFKTRYATFGFSDKARLDDGNMWPTDFALTKVGPAEEQRIAELVKRAIGERRAVT